MQQNQPFLNGLALEPAKSWKTILSIKQLPAGCLRRLCTGHAGGRSHWKRRPCHFEPAASLVVVGTRILPPRSPSNQRSNRTRSRNGANLVDHWLDFAQTGIPQGSVLGPILFTIFINDMPDIVESTMKLFADDAKIFKAIESFDDINVIQDDIDKLLKWSTEWQLPLNVSKCKCIHYGKNNPNHTYTMNKYWNWCRCIQRKDSAGVILTASWFNDINIGYRFHISTVCHSCCNNVMYFSKENLDISGSAWKNIMLAWHSCWHGLSWYWNYIYRARAVFAPCKHQQPDYSPVLAYYLWHILIFALYKYYSNKCIQ